MTTKTSLPQSFTLADLSGRRTLVTGAGRGIGLAIARRLVAGGARVAIADLDENGARAAASDKSMMRPSTKGPRSLMRTTTCFPFERLVTSTQV